MTKRKNAGIIRLKARTYEGADYAVEDKEYQRFLKDWVMAERLNEALTHLSSKQQALIRAIYFEGVTVNEYAKKEGVDHSAISHRLRTIYKKLKKVYIKILTFDLLSVRIVKDIKNQPFGKDDKI